MTTHSCNFELAARKAARLIWCVDLVETIRLLRILRTAVVSGCWAKCRFVFSRVWIWAGLALISMLLPSHAQETGERKFYIGAGVGENETPGTPWILGFMSVKSKQNLRLGFDFGQEGVLLDYTGKGYVGYSDQFSRAEERSAISLNLTGGLDFDLGSKTHFTAGGILGMRQERRYCPGTYGYAGSGLGYDCYADEDADVDWTFNPGSLWLLSFEQSALIGLRITQPGSILFFGLSY